MKSLAVSIALALLTVPSVASAKLDRKAIEVKSVFEGYKGPNVVDTSEEPAGDHGLAKTAKNSNVDIRRVAAANDSKFLRLDINLDGPVNKKLKAGYGFRITYKGNVTETFAYWPNTDTFIVTTSRDGKVQKRDEIKSTRRSTHAEIGQGIINGRRVTNGRVSLYLDKDRHFSTKGKGKTKWITVEFITAFYNTKGDLRIADTTPTVKLSYTR